MADEQVKNWCNWCQMIPVVTDTVEPVDHNELCFECRKIVGTPEDRDREREKYFDWARY